MHRLPTETSQHSSIEYETTNTMSRSKTLADIRESLKDSRLSQEKLKERENTAKEINRKMATLPMLAPIQEFVPNDSKISPPKNQSKPAGLKNLSSRDGPTKDKKEFKIPVKPAFGKTSIANPNPAISAKTKLLGGLSSTMGAGLAASMVAKTQTNDIEEGLKRLNEVKELMSTSKPKKAAENPGAASARAAPQKSKTHISKKSETEVLTDLDPIPVKLAEKKDSKAGSSRKISHDYHPSSSHNLNGTSAQPVPLSSQPAGLNSQPKLKSMAEMREKKSSTSHGIVNTSEKAALKKKMVEEIEKTYRDLMRRVNDMDKEFSMQTKTNDLHKEFTKMMESIKDNFKKHA